MTENLHIQVTMKHHYSNEILGLRAPSNIAQKNIKQIYCTEKTNITHKDVKRKKLKTQSTEFSMYTELCTACGVPVHLFTACYLAKRVGVSVLSIQQFSSLIACGWTRPWICWCRSGCSCTICRSVKTVLLGWLGSERFNRSNWANVKSVSNCMHNINLLLSFF